MIYIDDLNRKLRCEELDSNFREAENGMASNATAISDNASNININTTNISTNATDISTNATDISTNVDNIRVLQKRNFVSTVAPTITDDSSKGYVVNYSVWINTTTDKMYKCTDSTVDNAVWEEINMGGELEKVETATAGVYGWRYRGADTSKYLDIGEFSLDFIKWVSATAPIGTKGNHTISLGVDSEIEGHYSYVNGKKNKVTNTSYGIHLIGQNNNVSATRTTSVSGDSNIVSSTKNSIAKGWGNKLNYCEASIAIGDHCEVNNGDMTILIGYNCRSANYDKVQMFGEGLESSSSFSTWFGKYNTSDSTIKLGIGNGTGGTARANLIEVRENGTITLPSSIVTDIVGDKMLVTKELLDIETTATTGVGTARPVTPKVGTYYFDTDLAKPIWYNGTDWTDGIGVIV